MSKYLFVIRCLKNLLFVLGGVLLFVYVCVCVCSDPEATASHGDASHKSHYKYHHHHHHHHHHHISNLLGRGGDKANTINRDNTILQDDNLSAAMHIKRPKSYYWKILY